MSKQQEIPKQPPQSERIPDNEIWYTYTPTSDGDIETRIGYNKAFEAYIVSNTYEKGRGVITFDRKVTKIGDGAFSDNLSPTIINITIGEDWGFSDCSHITSIILPKTVTTIGNEAFRDCSRLTSIFIPNGVTSIGCWAFKHCVCLEHINIPDSVTCIWDDAFEGCVNLPVDNGIRYADTFVVEVVDKSLDTYILKDGTRFICDCAFYDCRNLKSITIPQSVTSIGCKAFAGCVNLPVIDNIMYADTYIVGVVDKTQFSYSLRAGVRFIGDEAFENCSNLINQDIPNGVISIGNKAFYGCSKLARIIIPDGVKEIGRSAFEGCKSLTNVVVPEGVTLIRSGVFAGCWKLTDISIPQSVTSIGDWAFKGCSITNLTISDSVTLIGNYAFYNCSQLATLIIGDCVTSIGKQAFYSCKSLMSVIIPSGVTSIGDGAFSTCKNLNKVTIYNGVSSIGDGAFRNCSITSVIIPNSVTSIGNEAFSGCSKLDNIVIPDGVKEIGYDAFAYCRSLESIVIPDGVTSIGDSAFCGCERLVEFKGKFASIDGRCLIVNGVLNSFAPAGLTSYSIPYGVASIGVGAFYDCSRLVDVVIPDSVTVIGNSAFGGCSNLERAIIPKGITQIGYNSFVWCEKLVEVYCKAQTPPEGVFMGHYDYIYEHTPWAAFNHNADNRKIYVSTKSMEAYKTANGWSDYESSIYGYDFE